MTRILIAAFVAGIATLAGHLPAQAASTLEFANVCGGVTVKTDAPDGTQVAIRRNGNPIGGFAVTDGMFTIAAAPAEKIGVSLAGGQAVEHTYVSPRGCSDTRVAISIDDHCVNSTMVLVQSMTTDSVPGKFVVTVGTTASDPFSVPMAKPLKLTDPPDGALIGIYQDLPSGLRAFHRNEKHVTPSGCGRGSMKADLVTDLCYSNVIVRARSTATGNQELKVFRNDQEVYAVPFKDVIAHSVNGFKPGDAIRVEHALSTGGTELLATGTYQPHAACSKPDRIDVKFDDTCAGTTVTVANYSFDRVFIIRTSDGFHDSVGVAVGQTKAIEVTGATVMVDVEMSEKPPLATHTFVKPVSCGALPITGPRTALMAASACAMLVIGAVFYLFTRRRRA